MASRTAPRKGSRSGSGSSAGPAVTQKSTTSSTKPRSPKLRDSCDPCAAAKVRCTKQKPICTRCEKRGIQCEYIVTRRAGRPSQNASRTSSKAMDFSYERQQDDMLGDSKAASPPSPPKTTSSEKGFFTSLSLIESAPIEQQMDICRTYSLPNLHEPCSDSLSDSPSLRCFADEVDSFFATLESLPGLDTSSRDMLSLPTHIDPMNSSASASANDPMIYDNMIPQTSDYELPFTEDPCLDLLQLTPQWQTLPQASPTITNPVATPPSHTGPCSCLTTALGLIRDFGSSNTFSTAWPHQKHTGAPSMLDFHFPTTTLQSLISSNEGILKTVTQILSCPCSQDTYLLTMLSLVVFKVLDRYAAAATMTTEGSPDPHDHNNSSKFRSNSSSNSSQASIRHTNSTPSLSPTSFSTTSSTTSSSLSHHPHPHHHQNQQQQSYQSPYPFTSAPARPSPPTTNTTTTTTTANDGTLLLLTSDTDPRRVSAQLVLGELHRAQRLVNELSTRFRSLGLTASPAAAANTSSSINHSTASANTTATGGGDDDVRMDGTGDGGGAGPTSNSNTASSNAPISTTMLEHLEKDLRARVRGVSKGVVEVIRRF